MANPEHLRILKDSVSAWNKWREQNPGSTPDLRGADLRNSALDAVDLHGASLRRADLHRARLRRARLVGADLSRTMLTSTDLCGAAMEDCNLYYANCQLAQMRNADLSRSHLGRANLRQADLTSSDLTGARLDGTIWGENDLSAVTGLDLVIHYGPSTIGIDTIYKSKGDLPEVFLRGCGVPEDLIVYMRSLVGKSIDFYSCFICYSTKDDDFAQRLYADLQAKNVRCWKFDENAKWGEPAWGEIDTAIQYYDKLVVVCSKHSLESVPVVREIERALQKEDREYKNVLFPIRIDDYLFDEWEHPRKPDVVSKVAGDFRGWRDLTGYSKAFRRFLDALNHPSPISPTG